MGLSPRDEVTVGMAGGLTLRALLAAALLAASRAWTGCTAEEDCLALPATPRCLPAAAGSGVACTLDYAFNETGFCACGAQQCTALTAPPAHPERKQLLVVGDSISLGYLASLTSNLSTWEVVHAPSFGAGGDNNDNAAWGARCIQGWLGPNASRWDAITFNHGAHDYAFPDNEHLSVDSFSLFISSIVGKLVALARPDAVLVWNAITPVPTTPPPQCVLLPGRLESDVLAYNAAAARAVAVVGAGRVASCDLHKVIDDVCGVGYASCAIAQCAGPHFSAAGFALLGNAVAGCIAAAQGV